MKYVLTALLVLGMSADMAWGTQCSYGIDSTSASVAAAGTGTRPLKLVVSAASGCAWTAVSNSAFITVASGASGSGAGNVTLNVSANGVSGRSGTVTIGGNTFTVNQAGTGPTMSLDKTSLQFGAMTNATEWDYGASSFVAQTGTQTVRLLQSGPGTVTWTASKSHPWITVTPTSGTGAATLTVGVQFDWSVALTGTPSEMAAALASWTGTVSLSFTGAGNTAGPITVGLTTMTLDGTSAPFGSFDAPTDNATGVAGSIGVTGWVLDDIGIASVKIWRDPVTGEGGQVFIGDAVLVDGARPDVATQYSTKPRNTFAGWGYLMLTNFLPSQGNGTFHITAIATDLEGNTTTLGTKTITCTNNSATKPFGAIDLPGQGEVISGSSYANFGWVLAHAPDFADPPDGGTVGAFIDGVSIGTPAGWSARPDLTTLFPALGYPGVSKALAVIGINTTTLTNGVHTIYWLATGTNGEQGGIGSRFITVANSSLIAGSSGARELGGSGERESAWEPSAAEASEREPRLALGVGPQRDGEKWGPTRSEKSGQSLRFEAPALMVPQRVRVNVSLVDEVNAAPLERSAVVGRRGYDPSAPLRSYAVGASGRALMRAEELDRIQLYLGGPGYTGYMRVGGGLGPLPIGSTIDQSTGVFTWGAGVGFIHDYDLVFVRWGNGRAAGRQEMRISLAPKQSNRVGPQVVIDAPAPNATVDGAFLIGGWAADLDETVGTGVDTLHVWAYPTAGGDPIFLGATAHGGARPDVGAIFGDRFTNSGYGLIVDSLPPGTYDLAVFAWSTVKGGFVPAKVVRVTVR